jgi:hypothetical protein
MADFGQFRGFGDKLFQGQLPTQLGTIGSGDFVGTDIDALAFFARVTAAGGTLSATEQLAIDALVKQMKNDAIWSKMKAIYPMVGASAAACAQNLKSSSFTGTFAGSWGFSSLGVQGNGANTEFITNFTLNDLLSENSVAFGMYSRTNFNSTGAGMTSKANVEFFGRYTPLGQQYSYLFEANNNGNNRASYLGLNSHSRTSISQKYMQTKTIIDSYTSSTSGILRDTSIVKFGKTTQGNDPNQYALFYISDGLDNVELLNLHYNVEYFQTTLSRNV